MFLIAYAADILFLRVIVLMIISLLKCWIYGCKGYKRLNERKRIVRNQMGKAIKKMFTKQQDEKGAMEAEDYEHYIKSMIENE